MDTMPVADNVIRLLAKYSKGLQLAAEHGPRSGVLLEYAYQNTPQGHGAFGRFIDRTFLHLDAWDGIRQRIQTTKELVHEIVLRRRAAGASTTILDVASGTGRYLREISRDIGGDDLEIICHDRDPRQVVHGRRLSAAENLRMTFSVGDATDQASYLTSGDPDLIIAAGLFPLLADDQDVRAVMRLSFQHLNVGGCFLCTTLCNPQARLVPWEIPYGKRTAVRSPETIAEMLRAAGFMRIDQRFSQRDGFALVGWKLHA